MEQRAIEATAVAVDEGWWEDRSTPVPEERSPAQLLAFALIAGALLQLGLRGGATNLVVVLGVAVATAALCTRDRLPNRQARVLAVASLAPLAFLAIWASPWLAVTNVVAWAVLLVLAVVFARDGSVLDVGPGVVVARWLESIPEGTTASRLLAPLARRNRDRPHPGVARAVVAGLLCLPVLGIVAALLAAADPVFAALFTPDLHLGAAAGHLLWTAILAGWVVATVGAAGARHGEHVHVGRLGAPEVLTVLGLTALLLGVFVTSQLVALTGAGARLVSQAGLTPAEYARSGFFQLCWATAIIVGLLGVVRALAAPEVLGRRAVRATAALVPLLAIGLVAVSLRRLALYDAAFGLTMLRLWVAGAAVWMGGVLAFVAVRNAGVGRRRWVLGASLALALALVAVADLAGVEARVVDHNVARARHGAELDSAYLGTLSADATPALAGSGLQDEVRCGQEPDGVRRLNLAVQRAEADRSEACAP